VAFDASRFVVGSEWVYRARDDAASQRVRILAVTPNKNGVRLDIAFLDDPAQRVQAVPGARLRVPWSDVAAYDTLMAHWQRQGCGSRTGKWASRATVNCSNAHVRAMRQRSAC